MLIPNSSITPLDLTNNFRKVVENENPSNQVIVLRFGLSRVVISAVHSTPHLRGGRPKVAEDNTSGVAIWLARALGGTVILPGSAQLADPNYDLDENSNYKSLLKCIARPENFVLDIHGMLDNWGMDVSIGTARSESRVVQNLASIFSDVLSSEISVKIDEPFDASHPGTIAATCMRWGIPALQIELNLQARSKDNVNRTSELLLRACLEAEKVV